MALEVTMIKGLSEDSIKRLIGLKRAVDQRFDNVDKQLSGVKERLSSLEQDISQMKAIQNEHTSLLTQILERLPKS